MPRVFSLLAATALFVSPLLAVSPIAQQPGSQAEQGGQGVLGGVGIQPAGGQGRQGGGGRQGGRGAQEPQLPAPRSPGGRVLLASADPKEKGLWLPTIGITTPLAPPDEIPFQPWARALFDYRQTHELEPHARCKASGVSRQFQTPYGVEFVELPESQRLYIFDVGGPHTYRTVYMDGRTRPNNLQPSYYGYSIGWWDGDTLVIESTGFNESFWLDRRGVPHSERLRTLERFTRTSFGTIRYEVTIDDPNVYTRPWTGVFNLRWEPNTELFEYICQQANYADELMLGHYESVDMGSAIVP